MHHFVLASITQYSSHAIKILNLKLELRLRLATTRMIKAHVQCQYIYPEPL